MLTHNLASLGWDAYFDDSYRRYDHNLHVAGRVARVDRGVSTVLTTDGTLRASLAGHMLHVIAADPTTTPCVGDWVVVRRWPGPRHTMEAVLPRRTAIVRHGAGKAAKGQSIVANADTVAIVEALDPDPDLGRMERLSALAHESGARPVLILTKADRVSRPQLLAEDFALNVSGMNVHAVSAHTGAGIDELRAYVPAGRTLALIGASGSGKSTLVNALVGATAMRTRRLRADGKGRHTTTHRALVSVPEGGLVVDTPGLRLVGLFDGRVGEASVRADGLAHAFDDLEELAARCRFNDCRHETEPDCAVRAGIADGTVTARRFENWRKLHREQRLTRKRVDGRAAHTFKRSGGGTKGGRGPRGR